MICLEVMKLLVKLMALESWLPMTGRKEARLEATEAARLEVLNWILPLLMRPASINWS